MVGINRVVQRFVKGHVYKLYYPKTSDYSIVRFRKLHREDRLYSFTPVVDTAWGSFRLRGYHFSEVAKMNVKEVTLEELPTYLGEKYISPEFERVMRGESIYRRKKSKILPGKRSNV
jgi:hypothetical protein